MAFVRTVTGCESPGNAPVKIKVVMLPPTVIVLSSEVRFTALIAQLKVLALPLPSSLSDVTLKSADQQLRDVATAATASA